MGLWIYGYWDCFGDVFIRVGRTDIVVVVVVEKQSWQQRRDEP